MNVEAVSPLLLPFVAIAFAVFAIAGAGAAWVVRQGSAGAGRVLLVAVWFFGSVAITLVGYRQYGLAAVAPAAIAAGLSVAIVYAVVRRSAGGKSWLVAAAMVCAAAVAATAVLPLSLLLLAVAFRIDGP